MKFYTMLFFGLLLTGCGSESEDNTTNSEVVGDTDSTIDPDGSDTDNANTDNSDADNSDSDNANTGNSGSDSSGSDSSDSDSSGSEIPVISDDDSDDDAENVTDGTADDTTNDELAIIPSECEVSVAASSEDGENVPENVMGTDTSTRWSGKGLGETLRLDLCEYTTITAVNIALYSGDSRNSTFSIEVSNDDIVWIDALAKTTSSGDSADIESYTLDKITARYVRYTGYGNTNSTGEWNSVTVFNVVECTGDDCEPVNLVVPDESELPTIPVTPSDGDCESTGKMSYNGECVEWLDVYEAEYGEVSENSHLISYSPIEMAFDALAAQEVTPNGNGWRHELKIKSSGGYRVAMTAVYELFKANIKVELSDGAKTIVAQHHASDTGTITKLYVADLDEGGFDDAPDGTESNSIAGDGIFDVYIRLAKADGSGETKHLLTTLQTGESFNFEEENDHGVITVKINGQALSPLTIEDSTESYFKFGNYQQAQNPITGDKLASGNANDDYAAFYEQYFSTSLITFTEMSYIRIVD